MPEVVGRPRKMAGIDPVTKHSRLQARLLHAFEMTQKAEQHSLSSESHGKCKQIDLPSLTGNTYPAICTPSQNIRLKKL